MPLDALTRSTPSDTARMLGIEPIPAADLNAYRADMLRRYPGSRWCKYPNLAAAAMTLGFVGAILMTIISMLYAIAALWHQNLIEIGITMLLIGIGSSYIYVMCRKGILSTGITITEPAYWEEVNCGNSLIVAKLVAGIPIPDPILAMAAQINSLDADFVIGKLQQNRMIIDPYLIVRQRGWQGGEHEIVLGIWDETGIVRQAIQR